MTEPEAALVLSRFLLSASVLFLWGSSAYLALLVPEPLRAEIWARLRGARHVALALAAAAIGATLPLRSATLGEGWPSAIDPDLLVGVALETNIGMAWRIQAAALGAIITALVMLPTSYVLRATVILSAVMLASFSLTGHAAMNEGWVGRLHQVNNIVHLLAAGAWFGALPPVLLILRALAADSQNRAAAQALMGFSTMGHAAVAIVILSGVASTWLIVGRMPFDTASTYQVMLLLKILVVAAMVILAVANRYLLVPRLNRTRGIARGLAIGTAAEVALALTAIGLVAFFGTLEPT